MTAALDRAFEGPRLPMAVGLAALVVGLLAWTPYPVGIWHDDGVYALTARALASGAGLTLAGVPGNPPAVHFPPAYAVLLTPLWWLTPEVETFSRLAAGMNIVMLAVAAAAFAVYVRDGLALPPGLAAGVALVGFLHMELWRTAWVPLSEPLFVLLLVFALGALARLAPDRQAAAMARAGPNEPDPGAAAGPTHRPGAHLRPLLPAALLLLLLVHTRSAGLAFVVGAVVAVALYRGPRDGGLFAGVLIAGLLPWTLWSRWASSRIPEPLHDILGRYSGLLRDGPFADPAAFVAGLPAVLLDLGWAAARVLLPGLIGWPLRMLAIPALLVAVVGLVYLVRRRPELGWGLVVYGGLLALWPYRDPRLVAPVAPLLVLCLVVGARGLLALMPALAKTSRVPAPSAEAQPVRGGAGAFATGIAVVWVVAASAGAGSRLFAEGASRGHGIRTNQLDGMVAAVTDVTPPDAVVGAPELWAAVALHTGRQAVPSAAFRPSRLEGPVQGTPLDQYRIWQVAGLEYVVTEAAGRVHGDALDRIDELCPGTLSVAASWAGQAVVRVDWSAECRARLGLTELTSNPQDAP